MPERAWDVRVVHDARIPTADPAISLSADLYLPDTSSPVPALVSAYPYRKDLPTGSSSLAATLKSFARYGYACVLVDLRGTGASDGIQRPVCDAGEGDDVVTAIEWAASQAWCTGSVGMWGMSYGGVTTLRAASRRPPSLKAIMPMMCPPDPERDGMFPAGARVDMLQRVFWAGGLLAAQVLPPLDDHTSEVAQHRWKQRLHDTEPYLIDLARHGAGHPAWRPRAIDAGAITVPALCVGGWRDLYAAATTRAYTRLAGPKKLLIGPWGHSLPEESPVEPIDFLAIARRWWDHWLRGHDTGVMDEPAVTFFTGGEGGGWRCAATWPPPGIEVGLDTSAGSGASRLHARRDTDDGLVGAYRPNPTLGHLGGPLGLAGSPIGQPLDPRDQAGCIAVHSDPLPDDVVICGDPEVHVTLHPGDPTGGTGTGVSVQRLVARLAAIDATGRTCLLASGVLTPTVPDHVHRIPLTPISWTLRGGTRLTILLGDGDFPRLTPLATPTPFRVARIRLVIPTVPADDGATPHGITPLPPAGEEAAPGAVGLQGHFRITRDLVADGIEVQIGPAFPSTPTRHGHLFAMEGDIRARVTNGAADAAETTGRHVLSAHMRTGERVRATSEVRCTQTRLQAEARVEIDDTRVYTRTWDLPL